MYVWRNVVSLEAVVVVATAASLCGFPGATTCAAQGERPHDSVVDYVPSSQLSLLVTRQSRSWVAEDKWAHDEGVVATPPTAPQTSVDRWLEFEREYGIQHRSRSWFLRTLQSAKYGLDSASFAAKETARRLEFTYDFGSPTGLGGVTPKPRYSLPLFGTFNHAQLKSVLTEHDPQTGTPFVGLKLTIPFGEAD